MKLINKIFTTLLLSSSLINAMSYSLDKSNSSYNLIYATGHITHGDLNRLSSIYYSLPSNKQSIVVFNSNGGELNEGIKIGKFLKQNRIGSYVKDNGICASSCALAFLGGRAKNGKRFMVLPYSSNLGFHSFYYKNGNYVKVTKVQHDLSNLLSYTNYVGAPSYLVTKMFKTNSHSMYWVNSTDRRALRIKSAIAINSKRAYANSGVTYGSSASNFIKNYFAKLNNVLASNRGFDIYNTNALSSLRYKSWIHSNLAYSKLEGIKAISRNSVEAKVVYTLNSGKRLCSINRYKLAKKYNGWKIVRKSYKNCNNTSMRTLKKFAKALP